MSEKREGEAVDDGPYKLVSVPVFQVTDHRLLPFSWLE